MSKLSDIEGANRLSPSRKIDSVFPPKKPITALCFTESPCAQGDVTEKILSALSEQGSKATFIVYGSTEKEALNTAGRARLSLPQKGSESLGGAECCGGIVKKIAASGCEAALGGYSYIPIGRRKINLFSSYASFLTARDFYDDSLRLMNLLEELTGKTAALLSPPLDVLKSRDSKSVYDVCNALFCSHLSHTCGYGREFTGDGGEKAGEEKLLKEFSARLAVSQGYYNGKIINLCGGAGSPTTALPGILKLLSDRGYEITSVSDMINRYPFSDVGRDSPVFKSARRLIRRGYTLCYKSNRLRPKAAVVRSELYAMFIPPEIMKDYMCSRLTGEIACFEQNRRSEKDFLMTPGRAASAGMLYGYCAGWPLSDKFGAMTVKEFSAFLDKASAGIKVEWHPPEQRELTRADIINVVSDLIG